MMQMLISLGLIFFCQYSALFFDLCLFPKQSFPSYIYIYIIFIYVYVLLQIFMSNRKVGTIRNFVTFLAGIGIGLYAGQNLPDLYYYKIR